MGDNLDKTIKPRGMRLSRQNTLLHYFNVYAVKDRIDFQHLNSNATMINFEEIDLNTFMPSDEDHDTLAKNLSILMSRILVDNVSEMEHLSSVVVRHIDHKYEKDMSQKSQVVCSDMTWHNLLHHSCTFRYHWGSF